MTSLSRLTPLAAAVAVLAPALALHADPPRAAAPAEADDERVPVAVAKDRAKLLHRVYAATLDSMHHHFFRRDRAVLPARALEDVFTSVDRGAGTKTRWIAVNTPAMSVHHEPATAFEKAAVVELATGKAAFERVEDGVYRRAGSIPLGAGCVSCHTKFSTAADKTPRFAGLVVEIPVRE
jgi:hypothetical protein